MRVAVNVAGRRECWVKLVVVDARTYTRRDAPQGLLPVSNPTHEVSVNASRSFSEDL